MAVVHGGHQTGNTRASCTDPKVNLIIFIGTKLAHHNPLPLVRISLISRRELKVLSSIQTRGYVATSQVRRRESARQRTPLWARREIAMKQMMDQLLTMIYANKFKLLCNYLREYFGLLSWQKGELTYIFCKQVDKKAGQLMIPEDKPKLLLQPYP